MNIQIFGYLVFVCILFEMQSVSGCVTQQFTSGNTILELSCPITSFTGSGIWRLDGSDRTSCLSSGFCTKITAGSYTFTSNTSGIYVKINPYSPAEAEKVWICIHSTISCNITVDPPSESPTVTTEMSSTSTSQDQTTSSQNPSIVPFHNTEKTKTTVMTTTDNDLTSSSLHVSSEVTTPIKTESDNLTDLGVSAIIAIAISGFIFLFLIIILIICCCQYYRKKSKGKTVQTVPKIHDDLIPTFGPNFNDHRYGNSGINGSTAHVARGYNRYQGESDRGYNVRSKHQSDNYNRRRSNKENITENRKHHPKQVQGKINHGFTQSIPNEISNRYDINGMNTYALHENYQNTRTHYREQAGSSPDRYEYRGSYLPHEYHNHRRRSSPYTIHLQEHVPRDLVGLVIYQGNNRDMNKQSRLYY